MPLPFLSIITVNFNQRELTRDLANSLKLLPYRNFELIIIDNGNKENCNAFEETFDFCRVIKNQTNNGFAGGNNLGIDAAHGDYLLFINNDTEVTKNLIPTLLNKLICHPKVGAVSPKIKFHLNKNTIQYAGGKKLSPFGVKATNIGYGQVDSEKFNTSCRTDYVHGACMMVKREMINQIGKLPADYFLYYEELEWSYLMKKHAWELLYVPSAVVYHKESKSTGTASPLKTYFLNRNRMLFVKRNLSGINKVISLLYLWFVTLPGNLLKFMNLQSPHQLNALVDAYYWNISSPSKGNKIDQKYIP